MALRPNIVGGVVGSTPRPGGGGPLVANGIRAFKSIGAMGAWINGRWHPNGAAAAMTGAEPPLEKVTPAYPGMLESLATKVDKDGKPTAAAEDAKELLVKAEASTIKSDDHAKAVAKVKEDVTKEAKAKAETEKGKALPPITGTLTVKEKADALKTNGK